MQRRRWLTYVLIVGLGVGGAFIAWNRGRSSARPGILLVTLDTTRADRLGCYGYPSAVTPTLDALARGGVLFESACTPVPLTLPSHATILTGLLPPEHGLHLNAQGTLDPDIPTLAELYSQQGYQTAAFIASFILNSRFGLHRGFDTYDDDLSQADKGSHGTHQLRSGRQVVDAALAWLRKSREAPFFCWVHLVDPHLPCQEHHDEFGAQFQGRAYDAEIAYADRQLGRLIDYLRGQNLLDQTLVVVVGDHGEGLGEHGEPDHGYMLYNTTMRVPLVFHAPEWVKTPRRANELVSLADLFPTLLEFAGLPAQAAISGRSLLPALRGSAMEERPCYGETDAPFAEGGWSPLRSLTAARWKYIRSVRSELYDLSADPGELENLFDRHPAEAAELEHELAALEGAFERRSPVSARLSEREQRLLSGLGYVGGAATAKSPVNGAELRDIKDVIAFPDQVETGMGLISAGEPARAEAILRKVVAAVPDYAKALGTLGVSLAKQHKNEEAADLFERALAADPGLDFVQFAFGRLLFDQHNPAEALAHFSEALRQNPDAPASHYFAAESSRILGDAARARKHFDRALELNPRFAQARMGLGNLALAENDTAEGVRQFELAIELNPRLAEAHERLAAAFAKQRRYAEAIERYQAAFTLDARLVPALVGLSRLLSGVEDDQLRDGAKGVRMAERACRLKPDDFEALDALAGGFAETGRWQEAVETGEKALEAARRSGTTGADADIAARLELYRNRKPYRLND